ncbi:FHA domain protein [Aquisphaera giovannonii]|uniref:FHA domain protein n=1 Tax=Aquisphaera giovannonii TaxID=406548 RepID=A0A5B9VYV7_9BACT|nr:FHA domain-containing protein [Aquisphaera giovannonii]QEH32810.1 FHA domain protein [Aquisphaera giovannonii]
MPPQADVLGTMVPVGGGDPIPLLKPELLVGRRPGCDIRLDFENVSGKHCTLLLVNGVWTVRDMGSTNGTSVNGARLSSPHALMPEDELGIADHLYTIDYVPSGPEAFIATHKVLDQDVQEDRKRHSLMELAGLDTDGVSAARAPRPKKAPTLIERVSADEAEFDDAVPEHFKSPAKPKPKKKEEDDDFLKLIEEEVKKPE